MEKELREAGKEFGIKCKCCGNVFYPTVENHYIAGESKGKTDIVESIINNYKIFYDAYDCPFCGTQHIMGERKDILRGRTKEQHEFIHTEVFESSVSNDTKKRILAGLLGARLEMRKKNMLTVDAMIAITDGLIYLVTGGEKVELSDKKPEEPKQKTDVTMVVRSRKANGDNLPDCFGNYDEDNVVECGCCSVDVVQ